MVSRGVGKASLEHRAQHWVRNLSLHIGDDHLRRVIKFKEHLESICCWLLRHLGVWKLVARASITALSAVAGIWVSWLGGVFLETFVSQC